MAQLYQCPTERRARGLLWLSNLGPGVLRQGPVVGVSSHGRPVVALGVGSMCQCPATGMIPTYPIVEFGQYVLSLLLSKAFQIGSTHGSFI